MSRLDPVSFPAVVSAQPKRVPFKDLPPELKAKLVLPSGFCRLVLKMALNDKQAEIMDALAPIFSFVSAACANETGKTSKLFAGSVLWHGAVFPRSTSVVTSGSWLQITNQMIPHLHRYKDKFQDWDFQQKGIIEKSTGRKVLTCFSTKDVGRAEGWHGSIDEPLLVGADEAKSIKDPIFTALDERVNPQRYLMGSSPGYAEGEFFRTQKVGSTWKRFKLTAYDCPHIEKHTIERRIKKWGIDHPLVRSAIFAEFMEFVENAVLTLTDWDDCLEDPPQQAPGERHAFIDFSGQGGDETVLAMRHGNEVWIEDCWNFLPEMATLGRLIKGLSKLKTDYGLRVEEVEGDADGMGAPMIGRLGEMGWPIQEFHGGTAPQNPQYYENLISETWFEGAKQIKEKTILIRDRRDEDLRGQACNRKIHPCSSGKLMVEPKKILCGPNRNQPSPDRADAVFGAMRKGVNNSRRNIIRRDPLDVVDDSMSIDADLIGGINAGL